VTFRVVVNLCAGQTLHLCVCGSEQQQQQLHPMEHTLYTNTGQPFELEDAEAGLAYDVEQHWDVTVPLPRSPATHAYSYAVCGSDGKHVRGLLSDAYTPTHSHEGVRSVTLPREASLCISDGYFLWHAARGVYEDVTCLAEGESQLQLALGWRMNLFAGDAPREALTWHKRVYAWSYIEMVVDTPPSPPSTSSSSSPVLLRRKTTRVWHRPQHPIELDLDYIQTVHQFRGEAVHSRDVRFNLYSVRDAPGKPFATGMCMCMCVCVVCINMAHSLSLPHIYTYSHTHRTLVWA
jgi:hypothetical protein